MSSPRIPAPISAERRRAYRAYLVDLQHIYDLETSGQWRALRSGLEARLGKSPIGFVMNEDWAQRLADADFHLGIVEDAYRILVPYVAHTYERRTLDQASLAASLLGESYPGQAEFCIRQIMNCSGNSPSRAPYLLLGRTKDQLIFLSYLALGSSYNGGQIGSTYYYEQALRLRPGNPVATELLLFSYNAKPEKGPSEASLWRNDRILSQAIPNMRPGAFKIELENWQRAVREGISQRVWLRPAKPTPDRNMPTP